ncbi:hypothetical protein ACNA6I_23125 (plasmid) [Rossellomorea sp. FS2]|uniref:hypothetical protein n=1 Tax=Rossellomorea sp. FS2 TaxID=3391447 RepID=UPI003A4D56ED
MVLFILLFLVVFFIFAVFLSNQQGKSENLDSFLGEHGIRVSRAERFLDGTHLIYDQSSDRLWLYKEKGQKYIGANRNCIICCEVNIDDETEHRTSLSSAAGRAVVGGVLLGGLGAIVGGVTARKKSNHLIHEVTLKIYYDIAEQEPFAVDIKTFSDGRGSQSTDGFYKDAYNKTMAWSKFIEGYMR